MNKFEPMNVKVEDGFNIPLPKMVKIRQKFNTPVLHDIPAGLEKEINQEKIRSTVKPHEEIAIAVGSRGIANLKEIVSTVVNELKKLGAKPFLVPAMGSHGGASPEGQVEVLSQYGITEKTMGIPIRSSMEVIKIDTILGGLPIFIDRNAYEADGIVLIARIKPHTDFKGDYESGLMKMMCVGLGKHKGASALHSQGFDRFHEVIPLAGESVLKHASIRFGIAILENAYDETAEVVAVLQEEIPVIEKQLLRRAKEYMPKLLLDSIDVLVVEEIGKDVSGAGMDPNITGRTGSGLPGFEAPPIQKIVVLDLTEKTRGNATGIGFSDVTTLRLVNKIDFPVTYSNCITSTELSPAKIPVVMNTDRKAIVLALKCCNRITLSDAKMVRIKNSLDLNYIYVSESFLPEIKLREDIEIVGELEEFRFDEDENLMK